MKTFSLLGMLTLAVTLSAAPWSGTPEIEALRAEYIAPRTSMGEPLTDWEPVLKPIAERLAAGAKHPLEAAMQINRGLSEATGVIYSTQRDAALQDPLHSIRIGKASCTGLSILLANACRSIDIPARLVGCMWVKKPGNHTWVEVWDGAWYPLGAFEDTPPERLWFLPDAAQAIADNPKFAIYATRATPSPVGTRFWGWGVPADNVTERYQKSTPTQDDIEVYVAAVAAGQRVARTFTFRGKSYTTPSALQDMNDTVRLRLQQGEAFTLEIDGKSFTYIAQPNQLYLPDVTP